MSVLISFRVPENTLDLIDEAATATGKTRTDFVLDTARQRAVDVLLDQQLFMLDPAQYDAFVAALDDPPPPNEALVALMRRKPFWER